MNEYILRETDRQPLAEEWLKHDFYRSAVVLGIDIGLEGIGLHLRRGQQEIFGRSVMVELPQAEALAGRRQKRGWRHCRKNRKRRLHRLKLLFQKHGLPWLDTDRMSMAHPFRERFRGINNGVASKEALSICIRHCVVHRGYDYGGTEEGAFPWGDSPLLSKATEWLSTAYLTPDLKADLEQLAPQLLAGRNEAEQRDRFVYLLRDRLDWSEKNDIARVLAEHNKGGHDNLRIRARGFNFPRRKVWEHLESIICRHAHLVEDVDGLIAVLGLNPNEQPDAKAAAKAKQRAIFFYNRKTRFDMERHWAKKVNTCPFAGKLGGNPDERCAENGDLNVRCWKMLEFAATRRIEVDLTEGKGTAKKKRQLRHTLSAAATSKLIEFIENHHAATSPAAAPLWSVGKQLIEDDIKTALGDKTKPTPETKSDWNKAYFTQLKDLLTPTIANRKKRASLAATSARRLFNLASANKTDFTPEQMITRLRDGGFYDWRRSAAVDFNPFPQVELLLGRRIKHGKNRGELSATCQGLLRRIFAEHRDALDGATAPDYCVLEVIGDPPRNALQRAERDKDMKERRDKRDKLFAQFEMEDTGIASRRRRITLWEQQRGKCPYTGKDLPANPLDPSLEIEHVFPAEMGGLSVDDNLVLTWRDENAKKGKRTPLQFAGTSFQAMLANTSDMRWNVHKREIFAWGTKPEHYENGDVNGKLLVPNFGNTTRTAQLARQLRAEIMRWMQVDDKPDEAARRIGTPSGWLAAQARKSWLPADEYQKVRNNLTHHLIDAAVLSHIPPREGMNSVRCNGIFYVESELVRNPVSGKTTGRLLTKALPELSPLPRLKHWLPANGEYAVNPVLKRRRESKTQSLGDSTFWRQVRPDEATLAQRQTLEKAISAKNTPTAETLLATLQRMGIPTKSIPSRASLQAWLDDATASTKADKDKPIEPLKLNDGTPVKNLWKFAGKSDEGVGGGGKGGLSSPVGWTGKRNLDGKLRELRSISLRYDRLELWLGYDHQKAERARRAKSLDWEQAGWVYQKRLIPDARALRHVKQMGFSFARDKRRNAPAFMQNKPDKTETHETLRDLVLGGRLLPFSHKVDEIRKGDEFRLALLPDGSIRKRTPTGQTEPASALSTFYAVTALKHGKGNPIVELTSQLFKDKEGTPMEKFAGDVLSRTLSTADDLACILSLSVAADEAKKRGWRIPTPPATATPPAKNTGGNLL